MRKAWRQGTRPSRVDRPTRLAALLAAVISLTAVLASPAWGSLGYELDATKPSRALGGGPKGLAVDQSSQDIYVAIVSTNPSTGAPGRIERFNSDLSADGIFAAGGFYTGVAVNPLTHGFYGAQVEIHTSFGNLGTPQLDRFTSAGALSGSSALDYNDSLPSIATDSAGNVFFPSVTRHSVQVFDSAGVLQEEITCGGCPGGSFGKPGSVALDSADNLYVADAAPDRVVKLTSSGGGPYSYASTIQSGRGAGAVAVDLSSGDVLVGDMPNGGNYHIVAYSSSGTQFDDFGAGLFPDIVAGYGSLSAYQIAINATTHKVYVGELNKFYVFEKVTIDPPSATANFATAVGQLDATLNASVNANGHAVLECEFEYTDEADFLANEFANATALPCPQKPDGSSSTPLKVRVAGLSPATDYRYRVTATSNAGSVSSSSSNFETFPAVPPTVTTGSPQEVGQSAATLTGTVNPHGGSVSDCHFELGKSLSYGTSLPCSPLPGPVTAAVAEVLKTSGLMPGTVYHYRLVVSSNAGTAAGGDITFTTLSTPLDPGPKDPESAPPAPTPRAATHPTEPPQGLRCRDGFRRQRIGGKPRCVKICKRGFRRKLVQGKVRCVKKRSSRRRHNRAPR